MIKEGICVVTVTYGKRANLLNEVILAIQNEKLVKKLIIVNNAADLSEILNNKYKIDVDVINLKSNTGSANGYNVGYQEALKTGFEYIFTIDDDNLPDDRCIENLYNYYKKLDENNTKMIALLAFREDRIDFSRVASGYSPSASFSLGNSFLGWDLAKIPSKLYNKLLNKIHKRQNTVLKQVDYARVPIAPYGGLFIHRNLLGKIRLPNPNYYLYCDDYDFTFQISNGIGEIYLIPKCKIIDIDKSWFVKEKNGFIMSFLQSDSEFRIYYSVRNRVYFETRNLVNNKIAYFLNKASFVLLLYIFSILTKKKGRFKIIVKAMKNGKKGSLGIESFLN